MTAVSGDEGTPIKAFVSYAWTSEDHVARVRKLVDYLRHNGVDAILDQYALQPGMDTDRFMEQVAQQHVQKVIAICDATYVQKANSRTGGVGKEGTIMSQHVYDQLMTQGSPDEQRRRFVAVIFGFTDGKPQLPAMFGSSLYIDMSTDEKYDANIDRLLRFLLDQPELVAPPVGKVPAHLQGTPTAAPPTWARAQAFRRAVEEGRRVEPTLRAYLEELQAAVGALPPAVTDRQYDYPKVLEAAEAFLPVRNEFVELMDLAARHGALNADLLGDFFEEAVNGVVTQSETSSLNRATLTVTELVRAELMLYLTALCIRERQEDVLTALTDRTYFIEKHGTTQPDAFGAIYYVSDEFRNEFNRLRAQRYKSPEAEWLRERASFAKVDFARLQEADLILTVKSRLQRQASVQQTPTRYTSMWYAPTAIYWGRRDRFDLFVRFTSRRVLQRWLPYFGVTTAAELTVMIRAALGDAYARMTDGWGSLDHALNVEALGTLP
ncbi:SEFIR domain-containing protein [Deinococcus sp. YIM 134068]|uniref:SEFIR domain-containing protein n=1 Tax=Deinococcus lichenicola TaxID=3118910 RepID=UPI002F92E605